MSNENKNELRQPEGLGAETCSPPVDPRWGENFIKPIAKTMKTKGIAYMVIMIRDDGKAAFVLEPNLPENAKDQASD